MKRRSLGYVLASVGFQRRTHVAEWFRSGYWYQARIDRSGFVVSFIRVPGKWISLRTAARQEFLAADLADVARLVPFSERTRDPATRGPIGEVRP